MRPQKLTLRNFMPFRSADGQPHELDFSSLDLFAITGPMGSGKSSLIDAIVWCLFGRTARYSGDSKGVISTGASACEVSFDFTIGSRWYRAVRRTGKTTESGLSELEGDEWIQDTSGSELLTKRIEGLLGLDFDSFTKTVVLPQGRYAEFLISEPKKRRDLLAHILELGVYADVADRAKEVAGQAKTRAETLQETLAQYAGISREQLDHKRQEETSLSKQIVQIGQQEKTLQELVHTAATVTTTLARCTELQTEERIRQEEQHSANHKHTQAQAQVQTLSQKLAELEVEQKAIGYDADRHAMLQRAVSHLQAHRIATQNAEQKQATLTKAQEELNQLTQQRHQQKQQVAAAHTEHQNRATALQKALTSGGSIAELTEKIVHAKQWHELQAEERRLLEQQQTSTGQLATVQQTLAPLTQQISDNANSLRELTQQRDGLRQKEQDKRRAEDEAKRLGQELKDAISFEKRGRTELETAQAACQKANQEAQQHQEALTRTEQQEKDALHALEENRRQHEATHLRSTLRAGEHCPVCQQTVDVLPAPSQTAQHDLASLQAQVATIRQTLICVRQTAQDGAAVLAAARTKQEASQRQLAEREQRSHEAKEQFTKRFPGFSSLGAALQALQTERQGLTTALQAIEEKTQAVETQQQSVTQQREKAQREEATLTETLRGISTRLESLATQRSELAQSLTNVLSAGGNPEAILTAQRHTLSQAEHETKTAETQLRKAENALTTLTTQKVKHEGTLGVLRSQHETAQQHVASEAQAVRENLSLTEDTSLPEITELESELATCTRKHEQLTDLRKRLDTLRGEHEQIQRQVASLQADLHARERILRDTQDKRTQAEQRLAHARTDLQTAVQEHNLSDISADGAGLPDRLATVHEQAITLREQRSRLMAEIVELERRCVEKEQEEEKLQAAQTEEKLAAELRKLLGAEFTDFLSQGAVEALMRDAGVHLQRLTNGRYSFDIAYKRRTIELQIVDHEDHRRTRPTHSLSGGETFLASLAIALALSQGFRAIATGKAAQTSTECLILDEGFGTLDREGLQLVTETLQELRGEEGRIVGIITHVEEVAAAMPMRVDIHKSSQSSTISVSS